MEYTLKDKLLITKEFLNDLEMKSWQEIEHLQNQIANIEDTKENKTLIQLLKNLLTSYYVFAGGLESLTDEKVVYKTAELEEVASADKEAAPINSTYEDDCLTDLVFNASQPESTDSEYSEPFEYFVDFDEPVGEPLTDEDLYNN